MTDVPLILADGNGGWYTPVGTSRDVALAQFPLPLDPDPQRPDRYCEAVHEPTGYVCTYPSGHQYRHGASNGRVWLARWRT